MTERSAKVVPFAASALPMRNPRDRIKTVEELAAIVCQLDAAGKKVVQAHGTFDLLHLGHIRHLEAARRLGDVLVVTVTADEYVNKGPGRPVFAQELRAETLAALTYVDWVAVNSAPDAVSAIRCIKPHLYVKGQDYQNPDGDITGKITEERRAVEEHGGQLEFTDEITFSSSTIINRHLNVFEPHVREQLSTLREDGGLDEMLSLIEQVKDYRVLMVGDTIIDEYQYVMPMGKSPKENMIATRYQDRELFAGGVIAAANHVASFCRQVDVITCLGATHSFEDVVRDSLKPNVQLHASMRRGAPTTRKRRFLDPSYMRKLFEVYFMDDEPLTVDLQRHLDNQIAAMAPDYDLVIATDFGHGLIAPSTVEALTTYARFLAVNTQSNSANLGYNLITRYPRADYICIDAPEARLAVGDRLSNLGDIAHRLTTTKVNCGKIIITQGKHGCVTYQRGSVVHTIPAFAKNIVDTVGAGDAFLSVTSPLVAAGGAMHRIGFIGNVVGALKVEIVGHRRSIDKPSLVKAITGLLK
ncbi:MAG TPA: PfkB family carbohydrate kinase [Methyloceanibacter sp.]|jgi:rfaE bifunctional protein nucleotidyltransferase chain/domain